MSFVLFVRQRFGFLLAGLFVLLSIVPACVKHYKLAPDVFPQAERIDYDHHLVAQHVRHSTVYDQFTTLAVFDSLWFSDRMRKEYVALYAQRRGIQSAAQEELLKRNLEENSRWFVLYTLADIRHKKNNTLNEPHSYWSVSLSIDGQQPIASDQPKEVELEPEFERFFYPYANNFKTAYKITFKLTSQQAHIIRAKKYKSLEIIYSSPRNRVIIDWARQEKEPKVGHEDIYWV